MAGLNPNAKTFSFGDQQPNKRNQQQQQSQQPQQPQYFDPNGQQQQQPQFYNPNTPPQRQLYNPYQQQQQSQQYYAQQPIYNPPPSQQQYAPQQPDPAALAAQRAAVAAERNKAFEQANKPPARVDRPNMPLPGQGPAPTISISSNKPAATTQQSRPVRPNLPLPGEKPQPTSVDTSAPNGGISESAEGSWEDLDDETDNKSNVVQSTAKSTSTSSIAAAVAPVISLKTGTGSKTSSGSNTPRSSTPVNDVTDKVASMQIKPTSTPTAAANGDELTEEERAELAEMDGVSIEEVKQLEKEASEAKQAAAMKTATQQNKKANLDVDRPRISAVSDAASTLKSHDEREHINIVFIGHVDAGKSTISGQIMLLTDQVDERTMQKYEKEAKEKNRESWYLAYIMDTNEEERAKGKTVEVGRAHFTTAKKRFTLLDAPGHKNYVPNMIGGAQQADVGVLVISARKGEFEAGFDRGGQTREHAQLAKTLGLQKLVVLINKMDDPSVQWAQARYNDIHTQLSSFLKKWGFKDVDVTFIPCSGYTGANLKEVVSPSVCSWYTAKKSFFDILDDLPPLTRDSKAPLRLPIISKFKDMGSVYAVGKIESGTLVKNSNMIMCPTMVPIQCTGVSIDEVDVEVAKTGENVLVKLKGVDEEDVMSGYVLSYPDHPCRTAIAFDAQVRLMELLEHKPVLAAGYQCILHVHSTQVECYVSGIISGIDKKTGQKQKKRPKFAKDEDIIEMRLKCDQSIAIEPFDQFPQLGRFTLRDEGKTIGIGKVLRLVE